MIVFDQALKFIRLLTRYLFDKKQKEFQRVLPFGDYFVDRFEKAKYLGFGKGSSVYDSCLIFGDVSVGENTWIGPFTILDGSGKLIIGSNCNVSAGVQIYTHDTIERVISGAEITKSPVKIGDNVYLGPNTVIAKGVTIGDFVVVGANSFVSKDIPSNTKGWGSPFDIKGTSK